VIELNGAEDFGSEYSLGADVFDETLRVLARAAGREPEPSLELPETEAGAMS
jgi:hypothetical protein